MVTRFILITLFVLIIGFVIYIVTKTPSSSRNWEGGYDVLAEPTVVGDIVTIKNIRDWNYSAEKALSYNYFDSSYDSTQVSSVWFLVEPFAWWGAMAHTYFIFDFEDGRSLAFSIEVRREQGETYDGLRGVLNEYELFYVWATEQDVNSRRVLYQKNDLYMYPLKLSDNQRKNLFLKLAEESKKLVDKPKFYNTLTDNCTNLLAKHARQINYESLPFTSLIIPPGYAPSLLLKLGYIDASYTSIQSLKERYYVSDVIKNNPENVQEAVREYLKRDN